MSALVMLFVCTLVGAGLIAVLCALGAEPDSRLAEVDDPIEADDPRLPYGGAW